MANNENQDNKVNTNTTASKLKQVAAQKNGQVQDQPKKEGKTLIQLIEQMKPAIQEALPKHISPDRIARIAITTIRNNDKLKECNPISFLGAIMQSAQLGLEPNTNLGEAYIIPYGTEATFQVGYKGILKLAHNTGEYQAIYAHEVYKNDEFKYQLGLNKDIHHIPADVPEGDPIYYYAVYKLKNGGYDFSVWSKDKIKLHSQKFSSSVKQKRKSPWDTNFDSMAKKTVILDALKYAPKSIEFADAIEKDNTITTDFKDEPKKVDDIIDMAGFDQVQEPETEIVDAN
ncbi:recombinase RecT [Peribacillus frigoritolerans]|uniref:recombinase RecT n=1 Tax=Peribacillus frigoritolerans TaxID=450367 RepID=UPI0021CE542F|nr:recombinase RecT [Peribacillus frigoritolerans]MCU6603788.1 recombinase RecT [Peribacillus frigoritolerans]